MMHARANDDHNYGNGYGNEEKWMDGKVLGGGNAK